MLHLEIQGKEGIKEEEGSHKVISFTEIKQDKDWIQQQGGHWLPCPGQSAQGWMQKAEEDGKRSGWVW